MSGSGANVQRPTLDLAQLAQKVRDWRLARVSQKNFEQHAESIKSELRSLVERFGISDSKGSIFLELGSEVEGVTTLKNERRVTHTFNAEEAEKILRSKNMWEEPYVTYQPVIDPDTIRAAHFEKKLTRREFERIFGTRETFAFVSLDERGKVIS